jgi:hypothetical protein
MFFGIRLAYVQNKRWLAGTWNDNKKLLERCAKRGEDMVTKRISYYWGNKRDAHYIELGDRCIFTVPYNGKLLSESRYCLPVQFGEPEEPDDADMQRKLEIDGEEIDEDDAFEEQPDYVQWLDD